MIKVITYGTFDMLHHGHVKLLERAKALGDYLIVGVTSDDYDKTRGKINNQQSLMERIAAVEATGIADEIIVEEYEGQKIDDIRRNEIDVFTAGSDWEGKFDYLKEYCKVVYLPRTEGISSTDVRTQKRKLRLGLLGAAAFRAKVVNEARCVNGIEISGICDAAPSCGEDAAGVFHTEQYRELLDRVDAVYVMTKPERHYEDVKTALEAGKHVLCESPVACSWEQCGELFELARSKNLILMDAIKTAYSTAYERLLLMIKSGTIGKVVSVDSVCTSLRDGISAAGADLSRKWSSICSWGPVGMLPVFQILGTDYETKSFHTMFQDKGKNIDAFTKIDFAYAGAVASVKVAKGAKAEGELVITGTKGYIYVPAPWWKTDYFELKFEDQERNRRFFYQLDGEGIRYEFVSFAKSIESGKNMGYISEETSAEIARVVGDFNSRKDMVEIR